MAAEGSVDVFEDMIDELVWESHSGGKEREDREGRGRGEEGG